MHDSLDFAALYRDYFARAGFEPRTAQQWDERASGIAHAYGKPDSAYVRRFLERMNLDGAQSLLDVGCGPGSICLPLAGRMKQVVALDFSTVMLDTLRSRAQAMGLTHVQCLQRSWHDDWDDVPACDIVVASRCMMLPDLQAGLEKLVARTRMRAYTTHIVNTHYVCDDVLRHIGRPVVGAPDHLYVLAILYQMGLRASLDFLPAPVEYVGGAQLSEAEFIDRVARSTSELNDDERERLGAYYRRHAPEGRLGIVHDKTWAFVSWEAD